MKYVDLLGNMAGITGLLVWHLAGVLRVVGGYYLMGFQTPILFTGGILLNLMAWLTNLYHMASAHRV